MKYWLFYFVNTLLVLPLRVFIRRLYIGGEENYPKGKPVMLASTHPNSFFDGVVFEHFYFFRKMFSLARGDAFKKSMPNKILRSMMLLPIYRARDAKAQAARQGNARTYDECYDRFKKDDTILIFPEGISKPIKEIERLKKGTGAIAVDMAKRSDFKMDLKVVPTAINYSKFGGMRRTIHISFDKPINALGYKKEIEEDEMKVYTDITNRIATSLNANFVVTKGEHFIEKEFGHEMLINENAKPLSFIIKEQWKGSVKKLNNLTQEGLTKISVYKKQLEQHKVLDANVKHTGFDYISMFIAIVTFAISFPVYLIWLAIWKIVVWGCHKKITNPTFIDSVIIGSAMILSTFLFIGVAIFFYNTTPSFWPIIFTIASIYGALSWFRLADDLPYLWKDLKWMSLADHKRKELENKRAEIMQLLKD